MIMQKHQLKSSFCLVSNNAYGALIGDENRHIGGVEIQANLFARWLIENGHDVKVIVWDEESRLEESVDGIEIIPLCKESDGIPGLRFLTPRWTSLLKALKKADADIYFHNCGEYVTGQVALWCKYSNRKFVYSVASDPDCDPQLPKMNKLRERLLYKYGLKNADLRIVQTDKQKNMLSEGFGLDSVMLPMPSEGAEYSHDLHKRHADFRVLWIGRIAPVKRLEYLLDIADTLQDVTFDVLGGVDQDQKYAESLIQKMQSKTNINYHGRVDREGMNEFYAKSSILCCTSEFEGFPNTFLESWSSGLPIVSTVDPDNLINTKKLGAVASSRDDLASNILLFKNSLELYKEASNRARDYFIEHHSKDKAFNAYLNNILKIV
jgi:glycosyltransferase involved in cell wall biosynthesis